MRLLATNHIRTKSWCVFIMYAFFAYCSMSCFLSIIIISNSVMFEFIFSKLSLNVCALKHINKRSRLQMNKRRTKKNIQTDYTVKRSLHMSNVRKIYSNSNFISIFCVECIKYQFSFIMHKHKWLSSVTMLICLCVQRFNVTNHWTTDSMNEKRKKIIIWWNHQGFICLNRQRIYFKRKSSISHHFFIGNAPTSTE